MIELGYLSFESRGDAKAEGIAIETYLGEAISSRITPATLTSADASVFSLPLASSISPTAITKMASARPLSSPRRWSMTIKGSCRGSSSCLTRRRFFALDEFDIVAFSFFGVNAPAKAECRSVFL
jgi:hypothetical protein